MTMKPCPFAPRKTRGAHDVIVVLPSEHAEQIVMLICPRCWHTERRAMALPTPMDDWPDDVLRAIGDRSGRLKL